MIVSVRNSAYDIATIMLRRTLLNCRLKTRVTIIGFSVLLICSLLMYRALTSHNAKNHPGHHAMPTLEQKKPERLKSEHKDFNIPAVHKFNDAFQANVIESQELWKGHLYADNIPKEFEILQDRDLLSADSREALTQFLTTLYPTNWANAPETDEVALELKHLLLDYGFDSKLSCKQIDSLRLGGPVSQSGTKFVEYAYDVSDEQGESHNFGYGNNIGGRTQHEKLAYIIKSSSSDTETKIACMKQIYDPDLCATMGSYRLLREVLLLNALRHPSIIVIKGYCLRGNRIATRLPEKGVIVVTEVGTPMTHSVLRSSTWSQKVSMALQIGQLLVYLQNSPLGSLHFKQLSLNDFVLVQENIIKLANLDDLEVGVKSCTDDSHCEVSDKNTGGRCKNGYCEGLNHATSFNTAAREVLQLMLQNPPGPDQEALATRLTSLNINLAQCVAELQMLLNRSRADVPLHLVKTDSALLVDNKEPHGIRIERQHNRGDNPVQADVWQGEHASLDEVLSNFVRCDHKNFAGIYDYLCAGSRVLWGCVHTVTSLSEAAVLCLKDHICLSFVAFSTQPESDNLMTVVLKNGTDSSPHESSGTTLFIRRPAVNIQGKDNNGDEKRETYEEKTKKSSAEVHNCIYHNLQSQELARYSREKRLMAHLGLKGIREQAWRRSALRQNMEGQSRLTRAEGGGGRFLANLTKRYTNDADNKATKVLFIAEDGPHVYHMAYALVYHLDRILGLYHTPPCVGKQLSAENVDQYLSNSQWDEMFRSLIESDGTLSGIIVAPMPKVMKNMELTLEPRKTMVTKVVSFSRSEKLQLEYILLWWLGRIDYKNRDHQAYKGHLIHFYADKAFTNMDLDMSAYMNHCQFPDVVYKLLVCFQCDSQQETTDDETNICSLGEEVIKRARAMFADDAEFFIHNMREGELVAAINSAATSVLHIIDVCIKTFGSDSVLY